MPRELDIVILSDVHLGTYGCHAKELNNYLKNIRPKTLILNGDFIDIWQFRKKYFPPLHLSILHRILQMSRQGTKVYYITGNHDDALRKFSDFSSGNIHLRDKLILDIKGKSYWIFHGDIFDLAIKISPLLAKLGGKSYDYLIRFNRLINRVRTSFGLSRMSFAGKVKNSVKKAVRFISDFEQTAIKLAAEQHYDYVICGHIHRPCIRKVQIGTQVVNYLNSGDWVENLTALEYNGNEWSLYEYEEVDYAIVNPRLRVKSVQPKAEHQDVLTSPSLEDLFRTIVRRERLPIE